MVHIPKLILNLICSSQVTNSKPTFWGPGGLGRQSRCLLSLVSKVSVQLSKIKRLFAWICAAKFMQIQCIIFLIVVSTYCCNEPVFPWRSSQFYLHLSIISQISYSSKNISPPTTLLHSSISEIQTNRKAFIFRIKFILQQQKWYCVSNTDLWYTFQFLNSLTSYYRCFIEKTLPEGLTITAFKSRQIYWNVL